GRLRVPVPEIRVRSCPAGRGIEFLRLVAKAPKLCGTQRHSLISPTQSLRHLRTSVKVVVHR
ncbi:MAG: hypothetical protein VXY72_03265, partial [Pseudomonadota bacterium]|nr:hypothetical protein [Pseudomonadota bacterium]